MSLVTDAQVDAVYNTLLLSGDLALYGFASEADKKKSIRSALSLSISNIATARYFSQNSQNAIQSTTFTTVNKCVFPGTLVVGLPTNVKVTVRTDAGVTAEVRLYDMTNAKVICGLPGIISLVEAIYDLGLMSNVPAAQAMWEIQARRVIGGGTSKLTIGSWGMQW